MTAARSPFSLRDAVVLSAIILAAACLIVLVTHDGILKLGVLERLEFATLDYRFHTRGERASPDNPFHVVIVEISQESFASLPERFPWPRSYYAHVVNNLAAAGARVIGIDLLFDTPDQATPENDDLFRDAIRKTGVVVLAGKREEDRPYIKLTSLTENYGNIFYDVDSSLGLVNIRPDADGIYRLYNVAYLMHTQEWNETLVPTFAFSILNKYFSLSPSTSPAVENDYFIYSGVRIPKYDAGSLMINFYGPSRTFPHIKFHDVIDDESFTTTEEQAAAQSVNTFSDPDYGYLYDDTFRDKIVLIGVTIPEYKDLFPVSIGRGEQKGDNLLYGVELHANVIENIIRNDFLTRQSTTSEFIAVLALVLLTFLAISRLKALRTKHHYLVEIYGAFLATAEVVLVAYLSLILFSSYNYVVNVTGALLAIVAGYSISTVYHLVSERKQRVLIKSMFSTYVNPSVVEELLADPRKLVLGGKREELTVLFSDIEGFTTISQDMPPERLVSLLNEYLSAMSEIIFHHSGTLDKYEGDAVMAFWGAPVPQQDHALRACLSALEMQQAVAQISARWPQEGKPRINIRIGINTGEMVVGNLGATGKFDYTVIGDSVNLASRLEGANKQYGTGIMVSQRTYDLVKDHIVARQLDRIAVKGRTAPVVTYELLQPSEGGIDPALRSFLHSYERALDAYYNREWDHAEELFLKALKSRPDDPTTTIHLNRISQYRLHPPPDSWDGVSILTSK